MDNPGASDIVRRRILMVIPELGYGGAERSFLSLARLLSEYHDVSIAVFKRHYANGKYAQEKCEVGFPLTVLDADVAINKFGRWMRRLRGLQVLKAEADVTISFLTGANILNVATGGKSRKIVSMRGSRRFDPAFSKFKLFFYEHLIDPLTFRYSDCVIAISEGLSNELKSKIGYKTRKKIRTIELFFDVEQLIKSSDGEIEDKILALKGQPVLISAGRLSPEKGFQSLLHVFAGVRQSIPNAKLILIGDGPLYQTLVDLCKSLNLPISDGESGLYESAVVFLGYRSSPHRYFRVANLFVSSSLTEGFSNIIVEALVTGIPVLATDCPWGPRSILWETPVNVTVPYPTEEPTYADYGVLMPRIDESKYYQVWVDELIKFLVNPTLVGQYLNKGKEKVAQLDSKRIAQKWFEIIDEATVKQDEAVNGK